MNDEHDDIPDPLKARFKALDGDVSVITARADAQVLRAAHSQFRNRRRTVWSAAGALAACLVLGVLLLPSGADPYDVDGSGTVDIVDALVLARRGGTDAEVDAIAQRAVSLGGTP